MKGKNILVGNGHYIGVLFTIPVMIKSQGHRFKVYTLVSETHDNVDMVMEMQMLFEMQGSIPFFPKTYVVLKPREQRCIKIDVLFKDVISGLAMIKLLDVKTDCTNMINAKFLGNTGYCDVTNNSSESLIENKFIL